LSPQKIPPNRMMPGASYSPNIVSERAEISSSMSLFTAYPIISVGFGYKF